MVKWDCVFSDTFLTNLNLGKAWFYHHFCFPSTWMSFSDIQLVCCNINLYSP